MKLLKFFTATCSILLISMPVMSAHISDTVVYQNHPSGNSTISHFADSYQYMNTDSSFNNGSGPQYAYFIDHARPNSVDQTQLNLAFDVASNSGLYHELVGYDVNDFFSSGEYPTPDSNTHFFNSNTFSDGYINTSSIGLLFEGFMIKSGNLTLVGLFESAISELYFKTFVKQGISHVSLFNTSISAIPVPAALWLFMPALFGLISIRRKYNQ